MGQQGLGEFEQMVLLAILRLGDEVYGVPVTEEIERRTGRDVSSAAVYVTLRRLEKKGLVRSWIGDPIHERGGKPRRYVAVEEAGITALRESREQMDSLWDGLDPSALEAR